MAHGRPELNTTVPRCHILSCTPWCVCRTACSISSSDAGSSRVVHSRVFSAPLYSFLVRCYAQLATVHAVAKCLPVKIRYFVKTVQRIVEILSPVDNHIFYTVSQRKEATKLLAITFLNLNRFSKFFHC